MKRTASAAGMNHNESQPPPKRAKVSQPPQALNVTPNEMKELLQLFKHFESNQTQNRILDRSLYGAYLSLSNTLNKDNNTDQQPINSDAFHSQIGAIVSNKRIIHCNLFIGQLIQLKAQIKAIRLLSRDIGLSPQISDLSHGVDNEHSWQRPYIDPLRTQNPSVCEHSKYNLEAMKKHTAEDEILIDSSPQTIEQLVYQDEYIGLKKLVHRRRMLKDYITRCEAKKSSKNTKNMKGKTPFNAQTYKKSRDELQLLELCELQNKVRNEILHSQMDKCIYDEDNAENEALLNPDLFARTAQIGLHFDPHVNSANHPPTMACSKGVFPFFYVGKR